VYVWWRALYAQLDAPPVVGLLVGLLKAVRTIAGRGTALSLIARGEHRFVFSGWPTHQPPWINLHMSRLFQRLRRGLNGHHTPASPRAARPVDGILRVGCVGYFSGSLGFPPALFAAKPAGVQLTIVDSIYRDVRAPYLRPLADRYVEADLSTSEGIDAAAHDIDAAGLDLLLNTDAGPSGYALLDRVAVPCVAHYCSGSDLVYHPRVAIQLHGQPQADYFVRDHRMFCGTTRQPFGAYAVIPFAGIYDRRDISFDAVRPWRERDPLIVFHGSLYKAANPDVLATLCGLLAEDSALELVMVGKERASEGERIHDAAARFGVGARVHVRPPFSAMRDAAGDVSDPGWAPLKDLLSRARLAPNPWPVGGGSARLEAYALGAPCVHLGVRFDEASWGRPQPSVTEIPHLLVPAGTAWSVAEYAALCRRCLHDEAFATALMRAQTEVAERATDVAGWWTQLLASYDWWRMTAPVGATGQ
jgi:hypothetical protein